MVEALGYSVHIISAEALNEQLPRLVPGVVQLYKKQSEHYYITQVMGAPALSLKRERGGGREEREREREREREEGGGGREEREGVENEKDTCTCALLPSFLSLLTSLLCVDSVCV